MLNSNTMRFATDEFSFSRQGLLVSKVALDTTGFTDIGTFTIAGAEPSGSIRRFAFKVNDTLYKIASGNLQTLSGSADYDNIIANGNVASDINGVTLNANLLNKKIYPIIALYSPADASVMPSAKISLSVSNSNDVYEQTVETAELELTDSEDVMPRISEVIVDSTTTGYAVVNVTARIYGENGWGEYMAVQSVKDVDARAIQFQIRYTVTAIGGADSARVNKITVKHTTGTSTVAGDTAEIYSVMRDYGNTLSTCSIAVRHKPLTDSRIGAYVNLAKPPKTRTFLPIGISDGTSQTLILGSNGVPDTGIDQSTLQLFANGNPIANFSYNTEVSQVTINIEAGKAITATYNYDVDPEVWHEMTIDVDQQPYDDGTRLTRLTYSLPEEDIDGQSVTNIRLLLFRNSGTVTDELLGTATGVTQQFVLKHAALADTLEVNAQFSYNEETQVLTCVAPAGTELLASYDWIGESHTVYSWSAAWAPAI